MTKENSVSNFIDSHIREIRYTAYGLGAVAIFLLLKRTKSTTKFLNVNAIPEKYVQHNYSLQGVIREVQQNGRLKVEHIPILELKAFSKYDIPKDQQYLELQLAGLDVGTEATEWLQSNTVGKEVWFHLLARQDNCIDCNIKMKREIGKKFYNWIVLPVKMVSKSVQGLSGILRLGTEAKKLPLVPVSTSGFVQETGRFTLFKLLLNLAAEIDVFSEKRSVWYISVNKELVKQGLCAVRQFDSPPHSHAYTRLLRQLITLEARASHRGLGMWKEESRLTRLTHQYLEKTSRLAALRDKLPSFPTTFTGRWRRPSMFKKKE